MSLDQRTIFRLTYTASLGTPVFALDYRVIGGPPVWWRRWFRGLRRLLQMSWHYLITPAGPTRN